MGDGFDRRRASVALARVDPERLAEAVSRVTDRYPATPLSAPTAGLAMMRLRESVNGDAFNLGEIPLSTASVELQVDDSHRVSGAAQIMADDPELATLLAVCDAAMSHSLPGTEELFGLLDEGKAELQKDQDVRQSMLQRTKVRFALLSEQEGA